MVFKHNFITVVKVDNKVLREKDGVVFLPFGSEYSIHMKNQNSRRAVVTVTIDSEDVLDGNRIVIDPNESTTIDGRMDSNGNVTNRFKFVKKTEKMVEHRGDRVDDGMLRIEYTFEKAVPEVHTTIYRTERTHTDIPWIIPSGVPYYDGGPTSRRITLGEVTCNMCTSLDGGIHNAIGASYSSAADSTPEILPDEGITVEGSQTQQHFSSTITGVLEENSHVIVLQLRGKAATGKISKPLTVKTKLTCKYCGTKHDSSCNYCSHCSACLI